MKKNVYVGLPCYNEEKDINTLIDRMLKVKKRLNEEFSYELKVFCVNDGSVDNTQKIIEKRKSDGIKLINHEKNKGLGAAMKTILYEFKSVAKKGDLLIVMDADNSHNPEYIIDLIKKHEKEKSDVVIASRYQKGADITGLKKHRILISDMAKLWYTIMLRIPKVKDYTCGYRLYTFDIVNKAIDKFGDKIITKTSFACMMELLYKLHLSGAKMSEIPFLLEYGKKMGQSKMKIFKTTKDSLITTIKIKQENSDRNFIPYIIILLITIGLLTMSGSTLKRVGLVFDPAVYLNVARNMLNGKVLYTGIVDNKGPILYLINALFLKIGGQTGIILLEFLLIFITFLYFYKTLKLINENKYQRIVILLLLGTFLAKFFTYGLSCEEYGLCFTSVGLYYCIKYYKEDSFNKWQCILLGILCALCFFIRQNLVMLFAGFGIGIFIKLIINKKYKELFKYILYALIGFLIITILVIAYLLINHCLKEYIEFTFLINVSLNKLGYFKSLFEIFKIIPFTLYIIVAYLIYLLYKLFYKKETKVLGIIFTIIITILFNIISAAIYEHYLISFIPIIMLSYNQLFNFKFSFKYFKYVVMLIIIVIGFLNIYYCKSNFNIPQPNKDVIEYVKNNTNENDKIAVIGFADEIYYLSKRESISRYTYVLSNSAFKNENQTRMVKEYINDIMNGKPTIIVEDLNTMILGVKPYISLEDYYDFRNNNYDIKLTINNKTIYELK